MLTSLNPYELNLQANIEVRAIDKSDGQAEETWTVAYAGVWTKRLAPPRGSERTEAMQQVSLQADSFLIREEGRTITAQNHRIVMSGQYFYITAVRPFKSSLDMTVLDTEKRDNE